MAILDAFGRPARYSHQFAKGAEQNSRNRPYEQVRNQGIEELVPPRDRITLMSGSRRLYMNMGVARGAIDQRASYSVGRGWLPVFTGEDGEWGDAAEAWLRDQWYALSDVRGVNHDFRTNLYLDSVALDRDGEIFILLTETEGGWPQLQHIPAHRVGQRRSTDCIVEGGMFAGEEIHDGIIRSKIGRPLGYRVLGKDEKGGEDRDIPAANMLHIFDPSWHESGRGLPALTHALNDLRDMLYSQEWETLALAQLSSIGLIEYNEFGGPDPNDPSTQLVAGATAADGITYSTVAGGTARYFKANSGAKLDTIDHDRPGDAWDRFQDRLTRSALAGLNWPYSLVWKSSDLTGVSQRSELQKAQSSIEDRQDILRGPARRIIGWAISKAIKRGILPESDEWFKWSFSMPPKISIDPGRDSQRNLDEWRSGSKNQTEILGERGRVLEDHLRERAHEVAARKRIAREVEEETGEEIDAREMAMLTPNDMPDPDEDDNPNEETE